MPKDSQMDSLARRNRSTFRDLTHLYCHNPISSLKLDASDPWDRRLAVQRAPLTEDEDVMDVVESCFSSLNLHDSQMAEGGTPPEELRTSCAKLPDSQRKSGAGLPLDVKVSVSNSRPESPTESCEPATKGEHTDMLDSEASPPSPCKAPMVESSALEQALKDNASLRRRVLALERRECNLKGQVRMHKRMITILASEAEGARRLLVMAEEHFQGFERTIEKLKDEKNRYCSWWLSKNHALKDLLGFVADPTDHRVALIASSSHARFVSFYSEVQ